MSRLKRKTKEMKRRGPEERETSGKGRKRGRNSEGGGERRREKLENKSNSHPFETG